MKKELEQKFWDRWPHWFNRVNGRLSLMCYGMSCHDGWFPILYKLCEDIEKELDETPFQKKFALWKQKTANRWNRLVYRVFDPIIENEDNFRKWLRVKFGSPIPERTIMHYNSWSGDLQHVLLLNPATRFHVIQIKEKFGRLCFYFGSDFRCDSPKGKRLRELVNTAEDAACDTCEECGSNDIVETKQWDGFRVDTLCQACARKMGYLSGLDAAAKKAKKKSVE